MASLANLSDVREALSGIDGRPIAVGGCVRDACMGIRPKDVDIEVHGLTFIELQRQLSATLDGKLDPVGRSFGVIKTRIGDLDIDISVPRTESKSGPGHKGFDVSFSPHMGFTEASRRRDLTINSMGVDLKSGEFLDPHGGMTDLIEGKLQAVDEETFADDPLRVLRVAQFAARLDMKPTSDLITLCGLLGIEEVAAERRFLELSKMLVKGEKPSLGLAFLAQADQLDETLPELSALIDTPQNPKWHPEGDVWIHTLMVVDEAAKLRNGKDDLALMFGALCHDFGKPTVSRVEDGVVRAKRHSEAGVEPSLAFLKRLKAPHELAMQVAVLVDKHLEPAMFPGQGAKPAAYRRLARTLAKSHVSMDLLERVARADQLGRTTELALARKTPSCDEFRAKAESMNIVDEPAKDVVRGRDLIERGWKPGPSMGSMLAQCRHAQYEGGLTDVDEIIATVQERDERRSLGR